MMVDSYRYWLLPCALLQEIEDNEAERELDLRVQDDFLREEKERRAREDGIMNEWLRLNASDALIDWGIKVIHHVRMCVRMYVQSGGRPQ